MIETQHIRSIAFWRARAPDQLAAARRRAEASQDCPFCNGVGRLSLTDLAEPWEGATSLEVDCVCLTLRYEQAIAELVARVDPGLADSQSAQTFEQLQYPEILDANEKPVDWTPLRLAAAALVSLTEHPWAHPWVYLHGEYGNGKSHLLAATYARLPGLAVYRYSEELAEEIFEALASHSYGALVNDLVGAPVLLLDDLGTEHAGSPFVINTISNLINRRYMQGQYRPTVITTNLRAEELRALYPRVLDRLTDAALVRRFKFAMPSFRPHTAGIVPTPPSGPPPKGFASGGNP